MNKITKIGILVTLVVMMLICTYKAGEVAGAQSGNGTPGSVNDPLITKSYLDERLSKAGIADGNGNSSNGMNKVELTKGKMIRGDEGTTFVLVSGSAVVGGNDIINITAGELMNDGMTVSKYATFLSTSAEGVIKAETKACVYVSGKYDIVN